MSIVLQAHSLTYSVGRRPLFSGLDLAVNTGDRLGLVGFNGSGKSTLLKMLAGQLEADKGHITRARNLRLAQVEQFLPVELLVKTLHAVVAEQVTVDDEWRAEAQLSRLGFTNAQMHQPLNSLSGGQLNRLMLARALVQEPQLLLLDEPTNHLDLATLALFEEVLDEFRGGLLLVSHDRTFLDLLCPTTLLLRDQKIYRFDLPYSEAREELARMDAAAAARRAAEEKKISQVRSSAKRMADWGRTYDNEDLAKRAKNMFRRAERMEEERTFVSKGSPLDLELTVGGSKGKRMLTLDNLEVSVPGKLLFTSQECFLRPGERIALLGHNGVGKTTLIKLILEQLAEEVVRVSETIRVSPQARLGYYDQELNAVSGSDSLFEFVGRDIKRDDQGIVSALVAAGFEFEAHATPVQSMSGGERARALFARLSLLKPNFLILDEPTNHIDIDGREQLEAQLLASSAAVLFTSHDREFVQSIAERFWIIEDGRLREELEPDDFFRRAAAGFEHTETGRETQAAAGPLRDASGEAVNGALNLSLNLSLNASLDLSLNRGALAEDALLERIDALETLLAEDVVRKPKFQKPLLQAEWSAELEVLNQQLENL